MGDLTTENWIALNSLRASLINRVKEYKSDSMNIQFSDGTVLERFNDFKELAIEDIKQEISMIEDYLGADLIVDNKSVDEQRIHSKTNFLIDIVRERNAYRVLAEYYYKKYKELQSDTKE